MRLRTALFEALRAANAACNGSPFSGEWKRQLGLIYAEHGDDQELIGIAGICDGAVHLIDDAHQHHPELVEALEAAGWRIYHEQDLARQRIPGGEL